MKSEKNKKEMYDINSRLLQSKQQQKQIELAAEAQLIEKMKMKFFEDEQKDIEDERIRTQQKLLHKQTIERQLEDKRFMTEQQRVDEMRLIEENNRKEEYRKKIVAEARKRLLEDHAAKLQGYLPT